MVRRKGHERATKGRRMDGTMPIWAIVHKKRDKEDERERGNNAPRSHY